MARNVVIIGANRGIGLEFCKQYAQAGDNVIAVCRKSSSQLDSLKCQVIEGIEVTDIGSFESLDAQVSCDVIDILIHNSGILKSDRFPDIDFDNMTEHFNVNTLGPLRSVLALKSKLKSGSKVGIVSSRVGSIDDNSSSNNYAYRVSKCAVNMVGKCLSIDLAEDGVSVALLHPGYVRTEMTGGSGLIEADEAARGLIQQMDRLNLSNTGMFVHTSGEQLTW